MYNIVGHCSQGNILNNEGIFEMAAPSVSSKIWSGGEEALHTHTHTDTHTHITVKIEGQHILKIHPYCNIMVKIWRYFTCLLIEQ